MELEIPQTSIEQDSDDSNFVERSDIASAPNDLNVNDNNPSPDPELLSAHLTNRPNPPLAKDNHTATPINNTKTPPIPNPTPLLQPTTVSSQWHQYFENEAQTISKDSITRCKNNSYSYIYFVPSSVPPSQSSSATHSIVTLYPTIRCNCPGFPYFRWCQHIRAVQLAFPEVWKKSDFLNVHNHNGAGVANPSSSFVPSQTVQTDTKTSNKRGRKSNDYPRNVKRVHTGDENNSPFRLLSAEPSQTKNLGIHTHSQQQHACENPQSSSSDSVYTTSTTLPVEKTPDSCDASTTTTTTLRPPDRVSLPLKPLPEVVTLKWLLDQWGPQIRNPR